MDEIEIGIVGTEAAALVERQPDWGRRPHRVFGEPAAGQPAIALCEDAFTALHRHAAGSDVEVGGLLLGEACAWEGETHVIVLAAVPARSTQAGPVHLTFTADSWAGMLACKQRRHAGATILGWYHSHPRMGIFLSAMDLELHHSFFREPWHIALVINGQDRIGGCFAWHEGKVQPVRRLIWLPRVAGRRRLEIATDQDRLTYRLLSGRRGRAAVAAAPDRGASRWGPWRR
jgi:proteasome lid subunit RPN8/RPN11